jgi:hypothetical protein
MGSSCICIYSHLTEKTEAQGGAPGHKTQLRGEDEVVREGFWWERVTGDPKLEEEEVQ